MASKNEILPIAPSLPDPKGLADAWERLFENSLELVRAAATRPAGSEPPIPFDPQAPARAFGEFAKTLLSDPAQLMKVQQDLLQQWTELWRSSAARAMGQEQAPLVAPERGDRRFNDPAWSEHLFFDYLKQAYLLTTRQTLDLVKSTDLDPQVRTRVDFFARQLLNAISPANFAFSNPEAIRKAFETGGVSLLSGLANMVADVASPTGLVTRRSADNFEIGVNIAATPGSVVFQNELMQLIQYAPATEQVYRRPLLYVPPLVNKYYVLDLQPKSSFVKWLVEQGHTVFVVSWINPGPELGGKTIDDYVALGPVAALDAIEQATGERVSDAFGFCMGGTLLTIAAGYLAGKGEGDRLGSLTIIGALLDFGETGEWSTFYEPSHMEAFERHVQEAGVIAAEKLQALFSVVRANDLIWSSVVNHYLLDRVAPASDLLFWFADGANIPQAFLVQYGRALLRDNLLRQPGGISISDVPIDLGAVHSPAAVISLKDDHVSGWEATYEGTKLLGGKNLFLLGGSGHNAGLVNPPAANKHGYWSNEELPETAEDWLAGARKQEGSWWPAWDAWLVAQGDGEKVPARLPGMGGLQIVEPAPGSYVRMK